MVNVHSYIHAHTGVSLTPMNQYMYFHIRLRTTSAQNCTNQLYTYTCATTVAAQQAAEMHTVYGSLCVLLSYDVWSLHA